MKKRICILMASAMLFVLAACQTYGQRSPRGVIADGNTGEQREEANASPAADEALTADEHYAVILGEYYTALSEEWDGAQMMEAGLNYMAADYHQGKPLEELGYAVTDLDGDGTAELLVGFRGENDSFRNMVFSLYVLNAEQDNAPLLILDSSERSRYYYAGENCFANVGAGAYGESFETTVKFEDGELIDMTYTTDPADYVQMELTPFSEWIK